ncbi:MAG: L-histidine N(alpha)-methyltransferase [Gemmatimonadetes bacterium]|nr:L-histidine N(alpha)-methyltransferase [Gemmatimonadota bacterium]
MLPPKYFYDERGAGLFERICELPEYYLTRVETGILAERAGEIAAAIGPNACVIEFGSGSGRKTRILLGQLDRPAAYVPIDISGAQLAQFARELRTEFPALPVLPVAADYTVAPILPAGMPAPRRTVAFFPGSSIGNLDAAAAEQFLRRVRDLCGESGALLVGADLHKDPATLELAYNDPQGVTAAFNLNLLARINRECGADFPLDAFAHRAVYDRRRQRIEMRLVCGRGCEVHVPLDGAASPHATFAFGAGDYLITEHSHKYTRESFAALAARSGWSVRACWTDAEAWFSVWLLG